MKWKPKVKLTRKDGLQLHLDDRVMDIEEKLHYLAKAVDSGTQDDDTLIRLIAQTEHINETAAAFGLAQFMIDYGDFIEQDKSHYMHIYTR